MYYAATKNRFSEGRPEIISAHRELIGSIEIAPASRRSAASPLFELVTAAAATTVCLLSLSFNRDSCDQSAW